VWLYSSLLECTQVLYGEPYCKTLRPLKPAFGWALAVYMILTDGRVPDILTFLETNRVQLPPTLKHPLNKRNSNEVDEVGDVGDVGNLLTLSRELVQDKEVIAAECSSEAEGIRCAS